MEIEQQSPLGNMDEIEYIDSNGQDEVQIIDSNGNDEVQVLHSNENVVNENEVSI